MWKGRDGKGAELKRSCKAVPQSTPREALKPDGLSVEPSWAKGQISLYIHMLASLGCRLPGETGMTLDKAT